MDFKPPYIGWFVGVIILVLGYLTSTCIGYQIYPVANIDCNGTEPNDPTIKFKKSLIDMQGTYVLVSCDTILLDGIYVQVNNDTIMFKIYKKEDNGYNCDFNPIVKDECDDWDSVTMRSNELIICTPWIDTKRQKLAEIPKSTEDIPSRKFSLKNLISFTYVVECEISVTHDGNEMSKYTSKLITFSTDTASKPNCNNFIDGPVSYIISSAGIASFLQFNLYYTKGFKCASSDFTVISYSNTTIDYVLKDEMIYCNKTTSEPLPFETSSVDLKEAELIKCLFKNLKKGDKDFESSHVSEEDFIYIIKNEKREKINCWEIIHDGYVTNYANKYLEFKLHDSQLTGLKCTAEGMEIIKRYNDTFTVMSDFAPLICITYLRPRTENDTDMQSFENKNLQCDFLIKDDNEDCTSRISRRNNFLSVYANDKRISCSSLIVNGLVEAKEQTKVEFRLHASILSGYSCNYTEEQIKYVQLGQAWSLIQMNSNDTLRCEKMKRNVSLVCWIKVYNELYGELEKNLVKIKVQAFNKIQCSDVILSGHINQTSNGIYSNAILKLTYGDNGILCIVNNQEGISVVEMKTKYIKIKMDITKELLCDDIWPVVSTADEQQTTNFPREQVEPTEPPPEINLENVQM